jgi:hypothetical protein
MCKKKNIKHQAITCFYCGEYFLNWKDKHIHRVDKTKSFNYNNTIVLCSNCKKELNKENIKIWRIHFNRCHLIRYFKVFSKKMLINFMRKIKQMQDKEVFNNAENKIYNNSLEC